MRKKEQDFNSKRKNHKETAQKVNPSKDAEKTEEERKPSFTYTQAGKTLTFEFMSDKRVKCPTCRKDFKNILRHLQQSGCKFKDMEELMQNFKKFKNKDDQR